DVLCPYLPLRLAWIVLSMLLPVLETTSCSTAKNAPPADTRHTPNASAIRGVRARCRPLPRTASSQTKIAVTIAPTVTTPTPSSDRPLRPPTTPATMEAAPTPVRNSSHATIRGTRCFMCSATAIAARITAPAMVISLPFRVLVENEDQRCCEDRHSDGGREIQEPSHEARDRVAAEDACIPERVVVGQRQPDQPALFVAVGNPRPGTDVGAVFSV